MRILLKLFLKKMSDYGTSWILFRLESLFDQLWIKAKRIRTLEELKDQKLIPEGRESEYVGIDKSPPHPRALPAGLLLLAITRILPQGIWQAARAALPPADISLDQLTNEKG